MNESIQNFKNARMRNRSSKASSHHNREYSSKKLNSSSSDQENHSFREPITHFSYLQNKPGRQDSFQSRPSSKIENSDSFVEGIDISPPNPRENEKEKTASFSINCTGITDHLENSDTSKEIQELFKEISELKNEQKGLEHHVEELEYRISKNLRDMHEPLIKADFSNIISRIGGLQEKFSNRTKSNLSTEKLTDLFEKISNLENEAERIKRENIEVETLYHQSLNEIYDKIEKLKVENKALTDVILSSSASASPKHSVSREFRKKLNSDSPERNIMYREISLKKVIEEEQEENSAMAELFREKELNERDDENRERIG